MKKFLLIALLFIVAKSYSQQYTPSQAWGNSFNRLNITAADTVGTKLGVTIISGVLYVANGTKWTPVGTGVDTFSISTRAWRKKGTDSLGAITVKYTDSTTRYVTPKQLRDSLANVSVVSRFNHDVVVNIPSGSLGAFSNGETIPLNGKRVDSLPDILATKCVAPSYVTPTAGITASPSNGSYERGTNLGTITLSSTTGTAINNGGAFTTTTYYQNGSPLGSNTTTISSLTSTQSFYVNKAYTQGACIANNCGTIDCTGRINAGTVNSSNISFTAFDKRYYGFANSTTPSNAEILALSQDNSGSTAALTLSNVTPSGSQFLVYFTKGTVTSVTVNGIPATGAFTITTYSVTNAQGYTQTYTYIISNNAQTSTLSSVIFN